MTDIESRLRDALSDRYRVGHLIGQGGMATVYLAHDLKHDRAVAIKVLLPDLAASVGYERFHREIEIAAKLQHPHILPVYDSGEAGELLFYVMPYVEGESLRDRLIRGGPLPPAEAAQLVAEVASALDYAHRQGIVHRDIKPANVLISDGHAVVADFGIARAVTVSAGDGLTVAGMAVGTPSYMSPEQALGAAEVDGRTDIYALGCVLYETLVGEPPYEGTTPQAIMAKAISEKAPQLKDDPRRLQPVIDRAMAREPKDRFQSAGELRAALQSGVTQPVAARSRRAPMITAGLAAVAAVALFALWPSGYRVDGDPRQSLIVFPFENLTGDSDKDYLEEASMNLLGLAISHWDEMRVFDDERTNSLMRRRGVDAAEDVDFDAAQSMAREARVGTIILGDIRRDGDSLAIEAKVHDVATGDRVSTEIVRTGFDDDPRPVFDAVAARILQVSGAPAGEQPDLVTQTTHSIEAYRSYLRGVEALQAFRIDSARAHLMQAVALDSTFALAYLRLRDLEGWTGIDASPERSREWVSRAQANAEGLPPRLRTLLQFHVAYENGEFGRARELASQLIAKDSSDVEAWYQLGEAHFHDRSGQFPHTDEMGNMGLALLAFQQALEIDSTYVLAYQHVTDVLGSCAGNNPWLCLPESAVYAPQAELSRRFGADRVAEIRDQARAARLEAANAWVDAAPRTTRARYNLLGMLLEEDRRTEARVQVAGLRTAGDTAGAQLWDAFIAVRDGRYSAAADSMASALQRTGAWDVFFSGSGPDPAFAILAGGGRLSRIDALADELVQALSASGNRTAGGPGGAQLPVTTIAEMVRFRARAEIAVDTAVIRDAARAFVAALDSLLGSDPAVHENALANSGSMLLSTYLVTRDTVLLVQFVSTIDTTTSRTWRTMDAHLALERGDSTRMYARLNPLVHDADSLEFRGAPGAVRAMAVADILTRLHRLDEAIRMYEHLDEWRQQVEHPGLAVRSLAERAALYQQLGNTTKALELYEQFIAAWDDGDGAVQPAVERARFAVATLRGDIAPERR